MKHRSHPAVLLLAVVTSFLWTLPCGASQVQIAIRPSLVRIGETARIDVTWPDCTPQGLKMEWATSGGEVRKTSGGFEYIPADRPGRAFVCLTVVDGDKLWGKAAVPVLVYRQIVILKADDFCAAPADCAERWKRYVNEVVLRRGIKVAMGVIADQVEQPAPEFRRWVNSWQAGGLVEFFNHGYDHAHALRENPLKKIAWEMLSPEEAQDIKEPPKDAVYEFQGPPMEEQLAHLAAAQQIMRDVFGIQMRTLGAPFNKWDKNTAVALGELGQNIDVWFAGGQTSGLFILPRGGGEIESRVGEPSVAGFIGSREEARRMIFLQHHPPFETFMKGWDQFLEILDRIAAEGGIFMLPGEYADLCRSGTLPMEPRAPIPDPALECALRMAAGQWDKPLVKDDFAKIKSLDWCWREPRIRSIAGLEKCTQLRSLNLRGNLIADVKPLTDLWSSGNREIDAILQGNPLPESFLCDQVPKLMAQGLRIHGSGACDNVLLTLRVDGQGTLEPKPGDYVKPRGSAVTLRARPAQGWQVREWEGAPGFEGKEEANVTLPGYCVITARFAPIGAGAADNSAGTPPTAQDQKKWTGSTVIN